MFINVIKNFLIHLTTMFWKIKHCNEQKYSLNVAKPHIFIFQIMWSDWTGFNDFDYL